jgi:MoaA/NifB/PqqE/SkfB family radical SAM enzyme
MLATTRDLDPVTYLGVERTTPFSYELSAPYRIDCALTYQTTSDELTVAPRERVRRELTTREWQTVLKKAWEAGIPHVIFTGGEQTLRPDLAELIAYAEQLGMVTGLLTDGSRLTVKDYIHHLLQSGLDHLTILLDDRDEQNWEALRDVLSEDIFVTVHLTLTAANQHSRVQVMERLKEMGVPAVSLSANDPGLKDVLKELGNSAAERDLQLVWNIPVPYSSFHPVAVELAEAGELPDGAGKAWLYVEPDGDVLATQGSPEVLGNLLTDTWEQIWKKH